MKKFEEKYYKENLINGYTFISEDDEFFFKDMYGEKKVCLIPPGINSIENNYKKLNGYNIVFTGKMDYEPNIQAIKWFYENIFPKIKKDIPEVKFYIVGKNPTTYIKNIASEDVIVTGEVESVTEYLNLANIVVIPLLSGGGVKIKLMEALQNNNIVISTSKGVEGTKFENKRDLFVTDNSQEFSNYCIEILKNPNEYKFLIDNAIEKINKNYLWESIGQKYEEYLKEFIDSTII